MTHCLGEFAENDYFEFSTSMSLETKYDLFIFRCVGCTGRRTKYACRVMKSATARAMALVLKTAQPASTLKTDRSASKPVPTPSTTTMVFAALVTPTAFMDATDLRTLLATGVATLVKRRFLMAR